MTSRELPVSIAVHATISIWPWCICLWNIFIRSGDFVIFEITYAAAAILDFHDNWIWHVNRHDGCLFLELCYIGLRIISVSVCLSLIILYCLTHVECFRFFDLAAIIAAPKLHTTTAVHATTISSSSSILRKIGRIYRSHTCGRLSSLGFKQVCSWLSTCFRPACDVLSTRSHKSKARFAAC